MTARVSLVCVLGAALLLPIPALRAGEKGADAPEVAVARPVVREVTDYEATNGRVESSARVEIRPLVSGFLTAVRFKDGDDVKQGDVLFELDSRPLQARADQALSQVDLGKATLQLARATLTRDQTVGKAAPGSVSQQQLDQDHAAVNEAEARVKAAEAGATLAKLDLDFCKIRAPIAGRIGRSLVDVGNLVRQDQTPLAVLVSLEPMYVYFNISERTYLDLRVGQRDPAAKLPVEIALPGEKDFSRRGVLSFVNNVVDRDSGSIELRGTVENKDRLLLPGMSVRVRLPLRGPYKAILVRDNVVKSNLDRNHIFVVDAQDKIEVRAVTLGPAQSDGLRAIAQGLMPEDRVVVGRLTGLQPGMKVRPRQVQMQRPDPAPLEETRSLRRPVGFGVTVEATYTGASPQIVFESLGFSIESRVSGLEGIRHLRSRCTSEGRYALDIAFASGVDLRRAEAQVKERIALALPDLPAAVRDAGVHVRGGSAGVLQILSLTSTDHAVDRRFLSGYAAANIQNMLSRVVGVADVALIGGGEIGVRIQLDLDRVRAYNLSAVDVVRTLEKEKWPARTTLRQMDELILRANVEGEVLRLRDVAKVELGPLHALGEATADGKLAVALVVYLAEEASAAKVHAALAARLRELEEEDFPPGMSLESDFDFAANYGFLRKPADCAVLDLDFDPALAGNTAAVLAKCEAAVREVAAVKHTLALSDNPFDVFGGRPCVLVQFDAQASGKAERAETLRTVRHKLAPLTGVTARVRDLSLPGSFPRCKYPIDMALRGPDAAEVRLWADKLAKRLRNNDSLSDVWLNPDTRLRRSRQVDVNPEQVAARGVALGEFITTLEVCAGSLSLPPLSLFGRALPVEVAASGRGGDSVPDLGNLWVRNAKGQLIAASTFATVRETETPATLDFFNLAPMAQITANPGVGVDLAAARKLCTNLAEETRRELRLPPEYRLVWPNP